MSVDGYPWPTGPPVSFAPALATPVLDTPVLDHDTDSKASKAAASKAALATPVLDTPASKAAASKAEAPPSVRSTHAGTPAANSSSPPDENINLLLAHLRRYKPPNLPKAARSAASKRSEAAAPAATAALASKVDVVELRRKNVPALHSHLSSLQQARKRTEAAMARSLHRQCKKQQVHHQVCVSSRARPPMSEPPQRAFESYLERINAHLVATLDEMCRRAEAW